WRRSNNEALGQCGIGAMRQWGNDCPRTRSAAARPPGRRAKRVSAWGRGPTRTKEKTLMLKKLAVVVALVAAPILLAAQGQGLVPGDRGWTGQTVQIGPLSP